VRRSLEKMEDLDIACGKIGREDESVNIKWIEKNASINPG